MTLAGVGGAFGGREDLSMQIHACLLALRTGKPVKMVYNREESFFGHVHRHPACDELHATAPTADGRLVFADVRDRPGRRRLHLGHLERRRQRRLARRRAVRGPEHQDRFLRRAHQQPAVRRDARLRRGAGVLRLRVDDGQAGRRARAGPGHHPPAQRGDPGRQSWPPGRSWRRRRRSPRCWRRSRPLPMPAPADTSDLRNLPGAPPTPRTAKAWCAASATALGVKNICFSEGFDDYSTARVRLELLRRHRRRPGAHRRRRGRAGPGHAGGADRAHRAGRRAGGHPPGRHLGRHRRFHLGLPAVATSPAAR